MSLQSVSEQYENNQTPAKTLVDYVALSQYINRPSGPGRTIVGVLGGVESQSASIVGRRMT